MIDLLSLAHKPKKNKIIAAKKASAAGATVQNQKSIIVNQVAIKRNQATIIKNQNELKKNQVIIKANQAHILKNQGLLKTIVANQAKILSKLK